MAAFALFGMMNWIYNWYRPERDVPVERLAEDISRIFLGGYLQEERRRSRPARARRPRASAALHLGHRHRG